MESVMPGLIFYYAYIILYFGMVITGIILFIKLQKIPNRKIRTSSNH